MVNAVDVNYSLTVHSKGLNASHLEVMKMDILIIFLVAIPGWFLYKSGVSKDDKGA